LYFEEDKQEEFAPCLPFSEDVHGVMYLTPWMALRQQQVFLGQTASASVQKQQQLQQSIRKAFEHKYSSLLPT
jgi:hypothetical protein